MPSLPTDQIFDNQIQSFKGVPAPHQLDRSLPKSTNETGTINAGMVVHVDGNAGFRLGCPTVAARLPMGYFAFKAENNLDTGNQIHPRNEWAMGNRPQFITAVAAATPCVIRTTSYVDGVLAAVADTPLVSTHDDADRGRLAVPAATGISQANIVAKTWDVVPAADPKTNLNRRWLAFVPVYAPARAAS